MKYSNAKRCAHDHPLLKIEHKDTGKVVSIQGGSCTSPCDGMRPEDYDVFIGLDAGMVHSDRKYPWEPGQCFLYKINDMTAPVDPDSFKALIDYIEAQLLADKTVFVGCIGGHGRTGIVLAALYKQMTGEEDAITIVRKKYCDRAVESRTQVKFLNKHYGIKIVKGCKEYSEDRFTVAGAKTGRTESRGANWKDYEEDTGGLSSDQLDFLDGVPPSNGTDMGTITHGSSMKATGAGYEKVATMKPSYSLKMS